MKHCYITILLLTMLALTGCNNTPVIEIAPSQSEMLKENMINANKYFASSEETEMDAYIGRRGWEMLKLSNGTRVWEYQKGSGPQPQGDDHVKVCYSVEALNGQKVYDLVEDELVMGQCKDLPGLETALRTLHYGSRAKVVIPSAMAYGVVGDGDKISTRMVLVLDIQLIQKNN